MSEDNICSATLEILNRKGLHAAFVKTVEQFDAEVTVERIGQCVSGCSIMGLMMLAAAKGTTIDVKTSGNQAQEALHAIRELVGNKFGEE